MKKIGFALEVFALMAVLPLYVVIEMNHATWHPTENAAVSKNIEKVNISHSTILQTTQYPIDMPSFSIKYGWWEQYIIQTTEGYLNTLISPIEEQSSND